MGGIRFHDRKRVCYFIDKGTSENFYAQLEQLNEWVKQEWVGQGNDAEDFEQKGPKLLMVLDNASYHKKKTTLLEIEQKLPNIQMYFLPPYSPELNRIEMLWRSMKYQWREFKWMPTDEIVQWVNGISRGFGNKYLFTF